MGKSTISMAIFNSYVKLPEGTMEHMKLNWDSSCCRSNLILAGVRAVKNKFETQWQIKMKWSWIRTIILFNLYVYIKFWNCNDYAYHTVQMFVNDLRKYKHQHQYNEKKCRGLTSNSCQVEGAWCHVLFLDYPILPYALSFSWHFVLRPMHFVLFF